MNKHLLSTSAIALGVAMAAPASAQQWDVNWGGFANTHVGIADISGTGVAPASISTAVNQFTNSEIIFSPSVTLDNGMTFGFTYQLEGLNNNNTDENYVTISSDTLGKVILGSENSAGYKSMVAAPQVGSMPINSRSTSAFIPVTGSGGFRQAALSSYTEVAGNNDIPRITYFTPSFNGLTLGVSYAVGPTAGNNASNNFPINRNAGLRDIFDIGANYSQSFNGVDVSLGARYGTGDSNVPLVSDPTTWGLGGSVGVAGFTFGIGYTENDNGAASGAGDQEGLSVGAAYDIAGPWTVGLEGYFGETKNGAAPSSDYDVYKLAASRDLGPGVSWDIYYVYQETNNGAAIAGAPGCGGTCIATNQSIDGSLLATAINLSF